MHETSCHWAWCRWYACLLDLKVPARVHRALLLSLNAHRSLGVMDTRLSANATSTRVSIYHNAGQCAENVHSRIRKQEESRLRLPTYNYRTPGGGECTLSVAQHFIPLRLRLHVSWFIRSEPKGSLIVCPCGFHNQDYFRPLNMAVLSPAKLLTRLVPTIQRYHTM